MTKKEALKHIKSILKETITNHGEAILATSGTDGTPHLSWMGTLSTPDVTKILTMTSPDSRKIENVLHDPRVSWMFTDKKKESVVCLKGVARVIHELDEIEDAWSSLKDKSRAYFMQYMNKPGMKFLVIETRIDVIEYTKPKDNIFKFVKPPFK